MEKVAAFVTRRRNGRTELLLIEHPNAGIQIPAGTVEAGEPPVHAAIREAQEETGLRSFASPTYIGCEDVTLPENKLAILHTTKVYARPDPTSFDWAQIRRGIFVERKRIESGYVQIAYEEGDRYPDPAYITYLVMGWVPAENVTKRVRRHYVHLTHTGPTEERWKQYADSHLFTLFWAPLSDLPAIVPSQRHWLEDTTNRLGYRFG